MYKIATQSGNRKIDLMSVSRYTSFDSTDLHAACLSTDLSIQTNAYETLWRYLYQVALKVVYDQPDSEAFAQDCAQIALLRIYRRIKECREPTAFRAWARRIVSNVAIDELRRQKRLITLDPLAMDNEDDSSIDLTAENQSLPEATVFEQIGLTELNNLIDKAPISGRSRRVIVGRYLDDTSDELLAQTESDIVSQRVLPSHIQVTRSRNITKLRHWDLLQLFLEEIP